MSEKYFDNGIATQPSKGALQAFREAESLWQCLSAPYHRSSSLQSSLEEWYNFLKGFIGFRSTDKCIFTSSSNEGISHIFSGVYKETILQMGKNQIVHLSIDEAPILLAAEELKPFHVITKQIDVTKTGGLLTKELLQESISPRTALVSLSWGHGMTGIIHPVWELAELCEQEGILLHIDATEILGKLYFHFEDLPVDFLTIDGARIHAPYGTGALITKRGSELPSFIPDVLQQDGMRGGIFNLQGFAGFTQAVKELGEHIDHMCVEMIRLRDLFEALIQEKIPEVKALFHEKERLPHVSVLSFPGIKAEHMQHALAYQKLYASRGGGIHQTLDAILIECGFAKEVALSSLSFSLSREHSENDIEEAVTIICDTYQKLSKGALKIYEEVAL